MATAEVVRRYWHDNAATFDSLYEAGSPFARAFNAVFRKALFERIRLTAEEVKQVSGATVLDVGCGSGRTAVPIAQAGAGHVTGVDFADAMIDLARTAADEAGVAGRCTFVVGNFMETSPTAPDGDERFDFVSAMGVFDYVDDPVPFLKRMLELAKVEAIFSVPKPSLVRAPLRKYRYGKFGVNVHFYTEAQARQLCADAGAASTTVVPVPAGYLVICRPQPRAEKPKAKAKKSS